MDVLLAAASMRTMGPTPRRHSILKSHYSVRVRKQRITRDTIDAAELANIQRLCSLPGAVFACIMHIVVCQHQINIATVHAVTL